MIALWAPRTSSTWAGTVRAVAGSVHGRGGASCAVPLLDGVRAGAGCLGAWGGDDEAVAIGTGAEPREQPQHRAVADPAATCRFPIRRRPRRGWPATTWPGRPRAHPGMSLSAASHEPVGSSGSRSITTVWNWSVPRPVSAVNWACTATSSPCSAMAPATETAIPETARTAVPLSSWSRRTASCQATLPPPSRRTVASTTQGSSNATPTSRAATPGHDPVLEPGALVLEPVAQRVQQRQPCHRQDQPPPQPAAAVTAAAHHAERLDHHPAQRRHRDHDRDDRNQHHDQRRERPGPAGSRRGRSSCRPARTGRTPRRPAPNSSPPTTSPSRAPARVSPAAIRRVMAASAPTSRSAASCRSLASPPNRTAVVTNSITGSSSTTRPTTPSSSNVGGSPSSRSDRPNVRTRVPDSSVSRSVPR